MKIKFVTNTQVRRALIRIKCGEENLGRIERDISRNRYLLYVNGVRWKADGEISKRRGVDFRAMPTLQAAKALARQLVSAE